MHCKGISSPRRFLAQAFRRELDNNINIFLDHNIPPYGPRKIDLLSSALKYLGISKFFVLKMSRNLYSYFFMIYSYNLILLEKPCIAPCIGLQASNCPLSRNS